MDIRKGNGDYIFKDKNTGKYLTVNCIESDDVKDARIYNRYTSVTFMYKRDSDRFIKVYLAEELQNIRKCKLKKLNETW